MEFLRIKDIPNFPQHPYKLVPRSGKISCLLEILFINQKIKTFFWKSINFFGDIFVFQHSPSNRTVPSLGQHSERSGRNIFPETLIYYLKNIKTIYFDDSLITFESTKNRTAQISIFASCIILITFFLYPSFLNNFVNTLFVN